MEEKMAGEIACPNCGKMISPDAFICKYCGKSTSVVSEKVAPKEITVDIFYDEMLAYQEQQKNDLHEIRNILVFFAVLVVLGIIYGVISVILLLQPIIR
jgi:ribosomal protein L32